VQKHYAKLRGGPQPRQRLVQPSGRLAVSLSNTITSMETVGALMAAHSELP